MTKSSTVDITCPNCKAAGQATAWTRIDAAESPEELQRLADGLLFDYACPECGSVSTLDYDSCVFDEETNTVVQYLANEDDLLDAKLAFGEALSEGITVRLVTLREAYAEKAGLLRDHLDDRAFEVMKFAVFNKLVGEGEIDAVSRPLYKGLNAEGEIQIKFVGGSEPAETVVTPMLYEQVQSQIPDQQPFIVDAEWAAETTRNLD